MQNRTRGKALSLRMTEDEHRFVLEKMQAAKRKNQTDFFLEVLRDKPIIVVEEIAAVLAELKRQGSNLNQVARSLNERGVFGESAKTVMNECWKSYRALARLEDVIACHCSKALPEKRKRRKPSTI
jgi:hypothetical protein